MTILSELRESQPRNFSVHVESNINPCVSCIIGPYRHLESYYVDNCEGCDVNPDNKKRGKEKA